MSRHIQLDIYDYDKRKICPLYDSKAKMDGAAYDIVYSFDIKGWRELSFDLPFVMSDRKTRNYRWDYIKSEYLVR